MWTKALAIAKKGIKAAKTAKAVKAAGDSGVDFGKTAKVGATIGGVGCLLSVAIIAAVVSVVFLAPLFYINQQMNKLESGFESFTEHLGNFVTFRGWCSDKECQQKEEEGFYTHIAELSQKYGVKLNTNLLVATLTYTDPGDFTEDDIEENLNDEDITDDFDTGSLGLVDYRKAKSRTTKLAKKLVKNYEQYQEDKRAGTAVLDIKDYYEPTLEEFVKKYYLDDKDNTDSKVKTIIKEIYLRVDFYELITSNNKKALSSIKVIVTNCNGTIELETVSLYDYIRGLLYIEAGATIYKDIPEFVTAMAIASKTYAFARNGINVDDIPSEIRMPSCELAQVFCDVDKGCHYSSDGKTYNGTFYRTIAPGPDPDGKYLREPITDEAMLEFIKGIVDKTFNLFIVNNGEFVVAEYRASCDSAAYCSKPQNRMDQTVARGMATNGSTYEEIIDHFYTGEITSISLAGGGGLPLDSKFNIVSSAWGWRVHPTKFVCRMHSGIDFRVGLNENIYAYAGGTVYFSGYEAGYGNYTIIGHGNNTNGYYEYYTLYAHMVRAPLVRAGDVVASGDHIGNVGSTGWSTGPHLHFEYYKMSDSGKQSFDPVSTLGLDVTVFGGNHYNTQGECCTANPGNC